MNGYMHLKSEWRRNYNCNFVLVPLFRYKELLTIDKGSHFSWSLVQNLTKSVLVRQHSKISNYSWVHGKIELLSRNVVLAKIVLLTECKLLMSRGFQWGKIQK